MEFLPMETAPTDGEIIFLRAVTFAGYISFDDEAQWRTEHKNGFIDTFWMKPESSGRIPGVPIGWKRTKKSLNQKKTQLKDDIKNSINNLVYSFEEDTGIRPNAIEVNMLVAKIEKDWIEDIILRF